MNVEFWRTAGIIAAAVGQTVFALLYLTYPWWKTFLGRALFFKAGALCILMDVAVFGRIYDWPAEDLTFVFLYWVLTIGVWFQFAAFLRVRLHQQPEAVSGNRVRDE